MNLVKGQEGGYKQMKCSSTLIPFHMIYMPRVQPLVLHKKGSINTQILPSSSWHLLRFTGRSQEMPDVSPVHLWKCIILLLNTFVLLELERVNSSTCFPLVPPPMKMSALHAGYLKMWLTDCHETFCKCSQGDKPFGFNSPCCLL